MSDTDDRNLPDEPDTDDDNQEDGDESEGDGPSADEPVATSGAAPDPGESGRLDSTRIRPTI